MIRTFLFSLAAALSVAACAPALGSGEDAASFADFESPGMIDLSLEQLSGDAAADARRAWSEGRRHLLGVHGYAPRVPGFPNERPPADWPHGVRYIAGTSDVIQGDEGLAFNRAALGYAARYNEAVRELAD